MTNTASTLYEVIQLNAQQHPNRTAIVFRDSVCTYADIYISATRLANALRARGIGQGDRVALLLPNCPQFTIAYYAAAALGAVCTPANPLLKAPELAYMWADSDAKAVIAASPLAPTAGDAIERTGAPRRLIIVGEAPEGIGAHESFDALVEEGQFEPLDTAEISPQSPAVCIYTSGTTGRPKGALLSHHNLLTNCRQIKQVLDIGPNDTFLTALPLFHSFAGTVCQNASLYSGACSAYLEGFHPGKVVETILKHRVTIFPGVPAMFAALLQIPEDRTPNLSGLRLCVSGGAPMPLSVMQAFEQRYGVIILEGDGPTECSPVTAVNPPKGVRKPGSIGLPVPGCDMRIFDEHDREVLIGQVGEIVVRGDNVMLGYHNLPEATAEAKRNGWYHTGDLGYRDEDGYFYIVDRKTDMIIVGGINVYPREVEERLYAHPAVADAAVIGRPDALRGEEPIAIVVLKPGMSATERELIAFCREELANYKVPRAVLFRDTMPRSDTGKILKRLLRKELELEARS